MPKLLNLQLEKHLAIVVSFRLLSKHNLFYNPLAVYKKSNFRGNFFFSIQVVSRVNGFSVANENWNVFCNIAVLTEHTFFLPVALVVFVINTDLSKSSWCHPEPTAALPAILDYRFVYGRNERKREKKPTLPPLYYHLDSVIDVKHFFSHPHSSYNLMSTNIFHFCCLPWHCARFS